MNGGGGKGVADVITQRLLSSTDRGRGGKTTETEGTAGP